MTKPKKDADPGLTSARSSAKKKKCQVKRRDKILDPADGGEGSNSAPLGRNSKIIEPQKKCDKGEIDWQSEADIARRMGIARQYLRNFREESLTEGQDFIFDGLAVLWRTTAFIAYILQLQLELDDIPKEDPPHALQVKQHYANKTILGCVDPEGDKNIIQRVQVRNSEMFVKNQLIPVMFRGHNLVLACRQPRRKGILK